MLPSNNDNEKDFFRHFAEPMDFGSKLRHLRLKAGLLQKDFAIKLNLDRRTVFRYEMNLTKPDEKIIERLVKVLKVSKKALSEKGVTNVAQEV